MSRIERATSMSPSYPYRHRRERRRPGACQQSGRAGSAEADPTHGGWFENFPWTRLPGVELPEGGKPLLSRSLAEQASPADLRELTGDGSFGGSYALPDDVMDEIWRTGVEEVRELLTDGWAFR